MREIHIAAGFVDLAATGILLYVFVRTVRQGRRARLATTGDARGALRSVQV